MTKKNYEGKIAIYTEPKFGYKWLMRIESQNKKKCKNDFFKHTYLSGPLIKIDENYKMETIPLKNIKTHLSNTRLKNLEFIESDELKELFK